MDRALKQRMVGAVVLIALGVIFIPMLLDSDSAETRRSVKLDIPPKPDQEYRSRVLPLDQPDSDAAGQEESAVQGRVRRDAPPRPSGADTSPAARTTRAPVSQSVEGENTAAEGTTGAEPAAGEQGTVEPEPAPAEGVAAGKSGALANWFVQVGSFSREANAEDLRDRLRAAGYTAFTETSTVEGSTTHRVKVGPEMDKGRAEKVRDQIADKYDLQGIVVSEP